MEERRQKDRIHTQLKILACNPSINADSRITNISCKGAFISTGGPLPVDTEATLHFQLFENSDILELNARVVWTKTHSNTTPAGMGIEFINIAPEDQEQLAAFIEKHQ